VKKIVLVIGVVFFVVGAIGVIAGIRGALASCLVTALVLLVGLWVCLETRRMVHRKRGRFHARAELSVDRLKSLFSSDTLPGSDVLRFLTRVENVTDVPKGKLRPDDRFAVELAPERGWEFDDRLNLLPLVLARDFGGGAEEYDLALNPSLRVLLTAVERAVMRQRPI